MPTAATSPRPSPRYSRACSSSIPSCACIASTRMPAARSHRCSPILRELQRRHAVAVLIVHHAKKGAGRARAGQALRGSSEFHAWGDSNLYLRRQAEDLILSVEHRAAPSMPPVSLELAQRGDALALEVVDRRAPVTPASNSLDERITSALAETGQPLPFADLRSRCRVRAATLYERLDSSCRWRPHRQGRRQLSPHQLLIAAITMTMAPTPRCFPLPLPGLSTACGNGNWNWKSTPIPTLPCHSSVRPQRSPFSCPGHAIPKPARAVAVKTGPLQGRRRLGLDGREHGGRLRRTGAGRSTSAGALLANLEKRAWRPIKERDRA